MTFGQKVQAADEKMYNYHLVRVWNTDRSMRHCLVFQDERAAGRCFQALSHYYRASIFRRPSVDLTTETMEKEDVRLHNFSMETDSALLVDADFIPELVGEPRRAFAKLVTPQSTRSHWSYRPWLNLHQKGPRGNPNPERSQEYEANSCERQ